MKLFGISAERSYWLATIGIVLAIYLWFFLMAVSKFIDIKNKKIVKQNEEELQSLKVQITTQQRFKTDTVSAEEITPALPDGLFQIYSTHFTVHSTNEPSLKDLAQLTEKIYGTIISDTNLYNFNPPERFLIYIYPDAQSYKENTKRPEWSGGFAANRKIYTFEGKHLSYILPHEITHLIFNDFMGVKAVKVSKWLNEGLAMYEETKNSDIKKPLFDKTKRLPLSEFLTFDFETAATEKVNIWYSQSESLTGFLLTEYPKEKFYNFLTKLRETKNTNEALFWGYQSEFKNMADLENAWLKE
ncbi:MAG: hypothetical protein HY919_05770 [Elusimicrobia bacterium]|nr:hypothetical protein [Elusimicrobiota bacterium]